MAKTVYTGNKTAFGYSLRETNPQGDIINRIFCRGAATIQEALKMATATTGVVKTVMPATAQFPNPATSVSYVDIFEAEQITLEATDDLKTQVINKWAALSSAKNKLEGKLNKVK